MTLLTYRIFKTVSESGSFHKTADLLGLTPSAISHTISGMEKELGFSVFTRGKAGVSLTSSGSQLLPYINAVLNSEESLQQAVSEMNGLQQGTVKVGAFSPMTMSLTGSKTASSISVSCPLPARRICRSNLFTGIRSCVSCPVTMKKRSRGIS